MLYMANYTGNSNSFKLQTVSYQENDPSWELINPFMTVNPSFLHSASMDSQNVMGFPTDHFMSQHLPQPHAKMLENSQSVVSYGSEHSGIKRKAEDCTENSSLNSSSPMSSDGNQKKNNSGRSGKRAKSSEKAGEKSDEVVHVRARRGQATDSHSIAERVRRGKINERLRCLQDIVPGCYKTMGMAVMLDEIINYVQSLQNQVEFLSMKLTAASQYYDFNAETEAIEKMQNIMQKVKAHNTEEAAQVERIISNGTYDQLMLPNFFQQTWPF